MFTRRLLIVLAVGPVLACTVGSYAASPPEGGSAGPRFRLAYATYLGGSQWDQAREVIPLPDASVLVGAQTASSDMATTAGVVQPRYAGDDPKLGHPGLFGGDCYLARLSADGRTMIAATYFGGSRQERNIYGMALDITGNIIITSTTRSPDLPTTPKAFQQKYAGGEGDCFAAKLSLDLTKLIWCTYVGGSGNETPRGGLALDAEDHVCLVGTTTSPNYPTTPGALLARTKDSQSAAFLTKLRADGSRLVFSTLFGGSADDHFLGARIDEQGEIYVAGHTKSPNLATPDAAQAKYAGKADVFLAKFSVDARRLVWLTYLGGREDEFPEYRLLLLPGGSTLLTGMTTSLDFPTTERAFQRQLHGRGDGFLTKLTPDGKRFEFTTLLGGRGSEFFLMPTVDERGNIYIVGQTDSQDLPVTPHAIQPKYGGGINDGVLALFSPDGSRLLYCTYLGGQGDDMIRSIARTPDGTVYLVGHTSSSDFPATTGALQTKFGGGTGDAFLVKLVPSP